MQGIYHYQVIRRMMNICEKYNLDYEVEEIFATQNRNKTQPGVSILPQVEQTHGEKAVEAHILPQFRYYPESRIGRQTS